MENNKINIAQILKDKPEGTRLYSPLFGECHLIYVKADEIWVRCGCSSFSFDAYGKKYEDGECMLFPSKEMRGWEKFSWKKGDVLKGDAPDTMLIFTEWANDYISFHAVFHLTNNGSIFYDKTRNCKTQFYTKVSDDEAKEFIKKVEEHYEGKLNLETLEIEQPKPEFKDGDIVVYGKSVAICRKVYEHTLYFYASLDEMFGLMFDHNNVSVKPYRLATDSEKQQLFAALKKENKVWNPDTKQIEDLPKKCEFKPFDRVLARDTREGEWRVDVFSHYNGKMTPEYPYRCIGNYWKSCIPYNDQTKHLLGTTDNWEGGEE